MKQTAFFNLAYILKQKMRFYQHQFHFHLFICRAAVVCALKPQTPEEEKIFQLGEGIQFDRTVIISNILVLFFLKYLFLWISKQTKIAMQNK